MRWIAAITLSLFFGTGIKTDAGVVIWNNIDFNEDPYTLTGNEFSYDLDLFLDEPATVYTDIIFDYNHSDMSVIYQNSTLDLYYDWYIAGYGDLINNTLLAGSAYQSFNTPGQSLAVPNSFYLAGRALEPGESDLNKADIFFWVAFNQSSSGLTMAGNAVAYGAESLTVGSYTFVPAVPEPNALMLFVTGLLIMILKPLTGIPPRERLLPHRP